MKDHDDLPIVSVIALISRLTRVRCVPFGASPIASTLGLGGMWLFNLVRPPVWLCKKSI